MKKFFYEHKKSITLFVFTIIFFSLAYFIEYPMIFIAFYNKISGIKNLKWLVTILGCISSSFLYSTFESFMKFKENKAKKETLRDIIIVLITFIPTIIFFIIGKQIDDSMIWTIIPCGCIALYNLISKKMTKEDKNPNNINKDQINKKIEIVLYDNENNKKDSIDLTNFINKYYDIKDNKNE